MGAGVRRTAGIALAGVVALAPHVLATDWQQFLARPLSPGAVALLVGYASEPRVLARWSEALKDARPEVRAAAARAINVSAALSLLPEVATALAAETDVAAAAEEASALVALGGPTRDGDLRAAAERDVRLAPAISAALARRRDAEPKAPADSPSRPTVWRIPDGFPPGLFADVLRTSGCAPGKKEAFHGGQVSYGRDGRPRHVTMLVPNRITAACVQAVEALLFVALAPPSEAGGGPHTDLLVVPLADQAIACMSENPPDLGVVPTLFPDDPSQVRPPRKVRHVAPWYPDTVGNARVQGDVVVEAVVAASGCVRGAKLLSSADPRLDVVALITVAQWGFTPTLIRGAPVAAMMRVTVSFRMP
jgi:TonB family protein